MDAFGRDILGPRKMSQSGRTGSGSEHNFPVSERSAHLDL